MSNVVPETCGPSSTDLTTDPAIVDGGHEQYGFSRDTDAERLTSTWQSFEIHLDDFSGPFDLLLSLIAKHELELTQVSLSAVTDEFVAFVRAAESVARDAEDNDRVSWFLSTASEFLLVAATLLDLKTASLLPGAERNDEEYSELLEARDVLFAKLLQYRAYKEVAEVLGRRLTSEGTRVPRTVPLDPEVADMLPELVWSLTADRLAELAAHALTVEFVPSQQVSLDHLHAQPVSVREQAAAMAHLLHDKRVASFSELTNGHERLVVVARFLGLLEMFREKSVVFDQAESLGELNVTWTGTTDQVSGTFDEYDDTEGGDPA